MDPYRRSGQIIPAFLGYLALSAALILTGCASPAPPRAPSLKLPQPVRDLTATRIGNSIELHFTAPANSTDKLPLRGPTLSGQLCRQLPHQPCLPVSPRTSVPLSNSNDPHNLVTWTDTLPPTLTEGTPQLLVYRVEFFSPANRSAGPSNQAFTASGPAPARVENFHAEGSRLGILLQWTPSPGEVVLRREAITPIKSIVPEPTATKTKAAPSTVWLQTNDSKGVQARTLDTAVLPDTPYQYIAQRRTILQLANHSIELRSDLSIPVNFTLLKIYPPPSPIGLTAAGFFTGTPPAFAVDLVWQPINEAGLITPLAGYTVYRETLNAAAQSATSRIQLNTTPVLQPAFHDATANPSATYRYTVTAIDARGNQSPATAVVLQPSATP
ncbi:MAG TPA: hypothetical protein VK814_13960 [Acidobacteriaceae bacterium]|jgi:hypothetical protein|nr:hypothetical protein [Acidobacteriaceae bacterium]